MAISSAYKARTLEKVILEASKIFKVVMITGMRQVGKTTCFMHLGQNHNRPMLSFDDFSLRNEASLQPAVFFKNHSLPLFLDEIQLVPDLMHQIKSEVDRSDHFGVVWCTGSQRFELMRHVSESLAGRMIALEMMPLSLYELQEHAFDQHPYYPTSTPAAVLVPKTVDETWQTIFQGLWPAMINFNSLQRELFFRALIDTYIDRDIRRESGITKLSDYNRFISLLASRIGAELRITSLARETGVAVNTVKEWLNVAESSGIIYMLRPYSSNIGKQLVKSPKIYFVDLGLAAYLCGFQTASELRNSDRAGVFFENFVVCEILKSWHNSGKRPELYFYRDSKTQEEIDLLIKVNGTLHPVEIKTSEHPSVHMIKNFGVLRAFKERVGFGAVICQCAKTQLLDENCIAHSIWQM